MVEAKLPIISFLIALLFFSTGCVVNDQITGVRYFDGSNVVGSGKLVSKVREAGQYSALVNHCSANINIRCGMPNELKVTAEDNLIDLITTSVVNGVLHISVKNNTRTSSAITLDIGVKNIQSVEVSGSGNVAIVGVSGNEFHALISGSGAITANGKVKDANYQIQGSGSIDCRSILANNVVAVVSGSGNIDLSSSVKLDASIFGSGNIRYCGNPKILTHVSGSGRISSH